MNKKALHQLSYGLFVLSALAGEQKSACVVNTVIQLSSEPVLLSVAVSKNNFTHDVLLKGKKCAVSVLSEETSMDTIRHFGFQSGSEVDKFKDFPHQSASNGAPYITDKTVAYFAGSVTKTLDIGTHTLFVIAVEEMDTLAKETPMTYSYYQTVKKGTSPKNAPSYDADAAQKGWRCGVCGYIAEAENLPEDFVCPVCKQPRETFKKI